MTSCPSDAAPAGAIAETVANPPEGIHPNAGAAANAHAALPPGLTPEMVAVGRKVYVGQIGGAPCTACHGDHGEGSVLGPALTTQKWLWGDGSYASIRRIIVRGVQKPKQFRNVMPPLGGAQLTNSQISAVSAYVWTLSHQR